MHAAIHARIFVTYIYMSIWHVHGTERLSPPVSMVHSCMACACDDAPQCSTSRQFGVTHLKDAGCI